MQRRTYLLFSSGILGGLAGCSGSSESNEPTVEPTDSNESTDDPSQENSSDGSAADTTEDQSSDGSDTIDPIEPQIKDISVSPEEPDRFDDLTIEYKIELQVYNEIFGSFVEYIITAPSGETVYESDQTYDGTHDGDTIVETIVIEPDVNQWEAGTHTISITLTDDLDEIQETTVDYEFEIIMGRATDSERVEDAIESVHEIIDEALEAYDQIEGLNTDWTDVTAAADGIPTDIIGTLVHINPILRDARSLDVAEYDSELDRLESEGDLITAIVRTQRDSIEVVDRARDAFDAVGRLDRPSHSLKTSYEDALNDTRIRLEGANSVENIHDNVTTGRDPRRDYQPKIDQITNEYEMIKIYGDWMDSADEYASAYNDAEREYNLGNYNTAQVNSEDVRNDLEDLADEIRSYEVLSEINENFANKVDNAINIADELRRDAATAQDE